jgi:hypothetical protein
VDCGKLKEQVWWFLQAWLWVLLTLAIVTFISTIFWFWMFIHSIINPIKDKAMWIIILLLLSIIWAILYYIIVKRNFSSEIKSTSQDILDPLYNDENQISN